MVAPQRLRIGISKLIQGKRTSSTARAPLSFFNPSQIVAKSFLQTAESQTRAELRCDYTRNPSKAPERHLYCIQVFEDSSTNLKIKQAEVASKYGLQPRDLRRFHTTNLPYLLVRRNAILLNLLHLKIIISRGQILLLRMHSTPNRASNEEFLGSFRRFIEQDRASLTNRSFFELRALEAAFLLATSYLEVELNTIRTRVSNILHQLDQDVDRHKLGYLFFLSEEVHVLQNKARLVGAVIEELVDEYHYRDMSHLVYGHHPESDVADSQMEAEVLVEFYVALCDKIIEECESLISTIKNTEQVAGLLLDANRNDFLILRLMMSIGALGLAAGCTFSSFFGANLESFIRTSYFGFPMVAAVSVGLSACAGGFGLRMLRESRKVKMMDRDRKFSLEGLGFKRRP
ncbi:hypothetical protein F4859DRAFT_174269 [Xylaria cf. heliscus]|nr:hypothetical protein F4859DRAFT_174269 [Xylaria cf. heliscus]